MRLSNRSSFGAFGSAINARATLPWLVAADAVCAVSALFGLELLQREIQLGWLMPEFAARLLLVLGITIPLSAVLRQGRNWATVTESSISRLILLSLSISAAWLGADFMLTRGEGLPRQLFGRFALLLPLLLLGVHWFTALVFRTLHLGERSDKRTAGTLVLGRADDARLLMEYVLRQAGAPQFRVIGVVTDVDGPLRSITMRPVLGSIENLDRIIEQLAAERRLPTLLVLATDTSELGDRARLGLERVVERYSLKVAHVAQGIRETLKIVDTSADDAVCTRQSVAPVPYGPAYLALRRALDVSAAAVGLILAAVPMVIVSALIWTRLGQPILFRQERVGQHGHPIVVIKFRTMRFASTSDGRLLPDQERQTSLGLLLRRLRLDELPQLWNVLKGDLSLVGPRPLIREDIERLPDRGYLRSFLRPGLSGWAQLHGGQALSDEEKFVLDAWYMKRANLWLDLWIVLKTPLYLLRLETPCRSTLERCREDIRSDARRWTNEARVALGDRPSDLPVVGQVAKAGEAA